jgi:hypothetical protein
MHGVDDAGVYFPPSLARYREIMAKRDELEAKVTELQARGTELENERRMWRARAEALKLLLCWSIIEAPMAALIKRSSDDEGWRELREVHEKILVVAERADRLEADAWTKCAALAKEFVQTAKDAVHECGVEGPEAGGWIGFVDDWAEKFKDALK